MDVNILLKALDNDANENIINMSYKKIKEMTHNMLSELELEDAVFKDYLTKLKQYLEELNKFSWDILFSGGCCDLHINKIHNKHIYETIGSRGTCMYILNKGVCNKLKDIINKETQIIKPIDHWFNDMNKKYGLKYFWSEPELVIQGSEIGLFKSVIR